MKIMIDAGHYGKTNRSPKVTKYYESEMTWKLQNFLVKALTDKYEVTVATTRKDQTKDLPVYTRGRKANGYDLFISLHSNAVGSYMKEGCDRIVLYHPIANKVGQKEFATKLGQAIFNVMDTKQQYFEVKTRAIESNQNLDYYGVIRGSVSVGCDHAYIIEHSFHTDTDACNWLLIDSNLQKLAQAECECIAKQFDLKEVPQSAQEEDEEEVARYQKIEDLPEKYLRDYCNELVKNGYLQGDENGNYDLTVDMIRGWIVQDRKNKRYKSLSEMPDGYWKDYATMLVDKGVLSGEDGNLDITIDLLRGVKLAEKNK